MIKDLSGICEILEVNQNLDAYNIGARNEKGNAAFVMRPKTTEEVSACVSYCVTHDINFVPQSANSGLVGASVANTSGTQAVLSLERLKTPIDLNLDNRSVKVGAGTRLSELNDKAAHHQLFFPIDLGADPMIGGMVATNTGGSRFLRYGGVRNHVLGMTVVMPDASGTVMQFGSGLRKSNTGADWKQVFIGSCGQLGVITEVTLNLEYIPSQQATALLVPASDEAIFSLLKFLESKLGPVLSSFEFLSEPVMRYTLAHSSSLINPFAPGQIPPMALLIELTRNTEPNDWDTSLEDMLEQVLTQAWELPDNPLEDALLGRSEQIWALRHACAEGVKQAGKLYAFDLSFERQTVIKFRTEMRGKLAAEFPEIEVCDFGHIGDGGLHFNLICHDQNLAGQPDYEQRLRDWVMHQAVEVYSGSFSAEHGVGPKNQRYYEKYTPGQIQKLTIDFVELIKTL